jgi:hypothetical protein
MIEMKALAEEYEKLLNYVKTVEYANKYLEKKNEKLTAKLAKCEKKLMKYKSNNIRLVVQDKGLMTLDELTVPPEPDFPPPSCEWDEEIDVDDEVDDNSQKQVWEPVNISQQVDIALYNNVIHRGSKHLDEEIAVGQAEPLEEEVVVQEEVVKKEVVEEEVIEVEEEEVEEDKEGAGGNVVPLEEEVVEEEVVEEVVPSEEDQDVYEVEINGNTYYVSNEVDSIIYAADDEGEITIEAGKYVNGKPVFNA